MNAASRPCGSPSCGADVVTGGGTSVVTGGGSAITSGGAGSVVDGTTLSSGPDGTGAATAALDTGTLGAATGSGSARWLSTYHSVTPRTTTTTAMVPTLSRSQNVVRSCGSNENVSSSSASDHASPASAVALSSTTTTVGSPASGAEACVCVDIVSPPGGESVPGRWYT